MYNGLIAIWKPTGMTSHDVVFKLRKILRMKKIGHTGTLDPEVEGLLLVCLGQATKLVDLLMDGQKIYQGQICLGIATETEDATGAVIASQPVDPELTIQAIDQAMANLEGEIQQIPPYYSAVKVNGKRLYEYARQGIEVERPVRIARIDSFKRISSPEYHPDNQTMTWDFHVECGKGTYVRTLAVDLGQALGFPSHMSYLKRLATGGFNQDQAVTLEQVQVHQDQGSIQEILYPLEHALKNFPRIDLTEDQFFPIKNGAVVERDFFPYTEIDLPTTLSYQDKLLAIYQPHPDKPHLLKPLKMFSDGF